MDPIVTEFIDESFRSYVNFSYVDLDKQLGKSWILEISIAK